jgi:hypothetical protein
MSAQKFDDLVSQETKRSPAWKFVGRQSALARVTPHHLHIHAQHLGNLGRIEDRGQIAAVRQPVLLYVNRSIIWK